MVRSYYNGTPVFLDPFGISLTHQITFIFQQLIYIPNNFISQQKYFKVRFEFLMRFFCYYRTQVSCVGLIFTQIKQHFI